ncbi:hypothetical protein MTQ01_04195 [Streptomyces sp. XM4193]|uniref:hypothetical protein n=1 Tax=Streptomyces sp. XM4193 TaxID=2929782 RepID=UPI001FFA12F1|nr:hypothetical protein [Streptomyces sp. XM4193]MCK1795222.1 hypothetical protein [Streptomyces sp. XM4193]
MNQAAVRRIGRTLALVLPVVLVLSGTLAVAQVPWAMAPSESQVLASSADEGLNESTTSRSPAYIKLQDGLVEELRAQDPGVALTSLQRAVDRKPSLAAHCQDLAEVLGREAVRKYGSVERAQEFSRPVCDTSFASGVAESR